MVLLFCGCSSGSGWFCCGWSVLAAGGESKVNGVLLLCVDSLCVSVFIEVAAASAGQVCEVC